MPKFSAASRARLETCDIRLQSLFNEVIRHFDCTVLEGHRGQDAQDNAYASGKSQVKWPDGKHNRMPSKAVDVAPYPIDWNDIRRFYYFAGFVLGVAARMQIPIRWGGDWDRDTLVNDQNFNDLVHFEVAE